MTRAAQTKARGAAHRTLPRRLRTNSDETSDAISRSSWGSGDRPVAAMRPGGLPGLCQRDRYRVGAAGPLAPFEDRRDVTECRVGRVQRSDGVQNQRSHDRPRRRAPARGLRRRHGGRGGRRGPYNDFAARHDDGHRARGPDRVGRSTSGDGALLRPVGRAPCVDVLLRQPLRGRKSARSAGGRGQPRGGARRVPASGLVVHRELPAGREAVRTDPGGAARGRR